VTVVGISFMKIVISEGMNKSLMKDKRNQFVAKLGYCRFGERYTLRLRNFHPFQSIRNLKYSLLVN